MWRWCYAFCLRPSAENAIFPNNPKKGMESNMNMQIKKMLIGCLTAALVSGAMALQVDVVKQGVAKVTVTLQVSGTAEA